MYLKFYRLIKNFVEFKTDSSYTISLDKGTFADRFYLQFNSALITSVNVPIENKNLQISAFGETIKLQFNNVEAANAELTVYDPLGRQVFSERNFSPNSGLADIKVPEIMKGVYVVKVNCDKKIYAGEVILGKDR